MSDLFTQGIDDHDRLRNQLRGQLGLLQEIANALIVALDDGHRIYLIGNGGSAADAQHIAAEMIGRLKRERRPLPAIALTTNTSNLLALGNDYGFAHVFTRQVEALVQPGDMVWALSTSGMSSNIIEALQVARSQEACIVGFTGQTGGKLKPLCDHCLCVNHSASDRIQEIHQLAYHMICEAVENHFAAPPTS